MLIKLTKAFAAASTLGMIVHVWSINIDYECQHCRYECTTSSVKRECSSDGSRVFREFHNSTLGPVTDIFCPTDVFPVNSSMCKKVFSQAKPKSGKAPENMISKMVVQLAPFLFASN